jgi:hypothetical protein
MGAMLQTILLCLATGFLLTFVMVAWLWLRRRMVPDHSPSPSSVDGVLAAVGAARWIETVGLLRELHRRGDAKALAEAWLRLAPPLIPMTPDCPPALVAPLRRLLADCADLCQGGVSKSISAMIDALPPG